LILVSIVSDREERGDAAQVQQDEEVKPKSRLKVFLITLGGIITVAAAVAGLVSDSLTTYKNIGKQSTSVVAAAASNPRANLNSALAGSNDPPLPEECGAGDGQLSRKLVRAVGYLKDGTPGGARPQDREAMALLRPLIGESPGSAAYWGLLARARLFSSGSSDAVLKDAKTAVRLCSGWAFGQNLVGNAHFAAGNSDEAEVAYRAALGLDPDFAAPRFNMALLLLQKKQYAQVIQHIDRVLKRDKFHRNAHLVRAQARMAEGQHTQALEDLEVALKLTPDNAATHALYGRALQSIGAADRARAALCKARTLGHPAGDKLCPESMQAEQNP